MDMRFGRREFLEGVTGLAVSLGQRGQVKSQAPSFMYVGSFTGKDRGHGEGLSVFHRSRESAAWTLVQRLAEIADPSFLIVDRAGRHLYSAHGDGTQVTAYRIDETTGQLEVLNQQATGGRNGVHLAIDATDRFLALANYATGSLALFPIGADGSLGARADLAETKGEPGPHRTQQESSHPHHCPFDLTGRFIVVPDKGLDRIFVYRLDTASGKLAAGNPPFVKSRAGAAPRHVGFHPTRPLAYVINELDSTLVTYQFDPEKGVLKALQVVPTLPPTYTGDNTAAEVAVAASGRFVYGSNRGHDSIAIFAVDHATGMLTSVGWESTQGRTPRFFTIDPAGAHLYAANQVSDSIVIFNVNQTSGALTPTGETIQVKTPTTIVFR